MRKSSRAAHDIPNQKRKLKVKWLLFAPLLLLLAACNLSLAGAMEEAVEKQYEAVSNYELVQQTPWEEGGVALVTFDAVNDRGMELEGCQGIGYFRHRFPGYAVFAATSSCDDPVATMPETEPGALVTVGYGSAPLVSQGISVAFGLVNEPDGAEVRILWEGGETETVAVVNGSYLVPRRGMTHVEQVVLLDATGAILAAETVQAEAKR